MNKFLIVLLAICLVSVHAFVRREAPADGTKQDVMDKINEFGESVKKMFDPEVVKKGFSEAIDNITKTVNELKAKSAEGPKN